MAQEPIYRVHVESYKDGSGTIRPLREGSYITVGIGNGFINGLYMNSVVHPMLDAQNQKVVVNTRTRKHYTLSSTDDNPYGEVLERTASAIVSHLPAP